MQDKTTEPLKIAPRNGVATLTGHGLDVRVERGYLQVKDGIADERRTGRFHKTDRSLKRLIVLGHSGTITFDALRWMHDAGVSFTQLDADANILAISGSIGRNDARIRRGQALAQHNGVALKLAKGLVQEKLLGQARVITNIDGTDAAARKVLELRERLMDSPDIERLRVFEAEAAKLYWEQWAGVPMQFVKKDVKRVPDHWLAFNQRVSQLTLSPRKAINPANALLNYLYAILEVETTLALHQVGLDPGLGVLHADQRGRESLALDVMEAARPDVDEFLLAAIRNQRFRKADFFETSEGGCRILPPLTERLIETGPRWGDAVGPRVEALAQELVNSSANARAIHLATPLSQANRSAGREGLRARRKAPIEPRFTLSICKACGEALADPDRTYCDKCLPEQRSEQVKEFAASGPRRLKQLRAAKQDPAHNDEANEQRKWTQQQHMLEQKRWELRQGGDVDPDFFKRRVAPGLKAFSLREIRARTGLSLRYCSLIRSGEKIPHPRHWPKLLRLTYEG